ncbi:MAG: hypothetical protein M1826_002278 [Phylliscum demangeonii]|nr:MAG: hypothetical protein M1826_002278 [Phylliscum demangeonii]
MSGGASTAAAKATTENTPRANGGAGTSKGTSSSPPKRSADEAAAGNDVAFDVLPASGQSAQGEPPRGPKKIKSYGAGAPKVRSGSALESKRSSEEGKARKVTQKEKTFKMPVLEKDVEIKLRSIEQSAGARSKFKDPGRLFPGLPLSPAVPLADGFKMPAYVLSDDDVEEEAQMPRFIHPMETRSKEAAVEDRNSGQDGPTKGSDNPHPTSSATDLSSTSLPLDPSISSNSSSLSTPPTLSRRNSSEWMTVEEKEAVQRERSMLVAICPLCKERIELSHKDHEDTKDDANGDTRRLRSMMKKMKAGGSAGRLSVRDQAAFCRRHKVRSARAQWRSRRYPDIDWEILGDRIKSYHPVMDAILQGKTQSVYRDELEDRVRHGRHRTTLMQSLSLITPREASTTTITTATTATTGSGAAADGRVTPSSQQAMPGTKSALLSVTAGYYGPRGAQVFEEMILARFAPDIRRLAARDKVMASGGVSEYIQAVLVPELATLLVREDMGVDEAEARRILNESAEMGELMHDEGW